MDISNFVRIEYHGQPVLTTNQIADAYGCSVQNVRYDFHYNKKQFVEGVHYFKLEGDALSEFKANYNEARTSYVPFAPFSKMASCLYLWTKEGLIRFCKIINTKTAWDVFKVLESAYFEKFNQIPKIETPKINSPRPKNSKSKKIKIKDSLTFEQLQFLISNCTDSNLRDSLIRKAAGNFEMPKCVYILLLENELVKIGITQNFQRRAREIITGTGFNVKNWCHTNYLPPEVARDIEINLQEIFQDFQADGEFFTADFNNAVEKLAEFEEVTEFQAIQ